MITEPTAPLPPSNLTWTTAGVPRLTAPRTPGTSSLQLGRTPAGERVVLVDDVEVILATIRQIESAGRYEIGPNRARASGAYQFIPSTWNNYGGYPEAYLAPPAVQDERARADVLRFLTMYGGDVSMVPVMWYYPRAALDHSWMDRVPNPAGGNRLTIREYQTRWLERLAANATDIAGNVCRRADHSRRGQRALVDAGARAGRARRSGCAPTPATPTAVPPAPAPPTPVPAMPGGQAGITSASPDAADPTLAPAVEITVDEVTVSESTMDLAARSAPPVIDVEDGLGSMRSIVFPVLGPVAYANGWGDPRSGGRRHEGTDIIGVRMQPVLAAVDGVISRYQPTSTGIRGVAISIADEDGWRYNYFHNNDDTPGTDDGAAAEAFRLAPGLELGDSVVAGQVIGYMGDSGNAEESVAHLHFELRDPTGQARPSFWSLRAAEARQACTIGIGPWSTPTVGEHAVGDADHTAAAPVAVAPANVASIVAPPIAAEAAGGRRRPADRAHGGHADVRRGAVGDRLRGPRHRDRRRRVDHAAPRPAVRRRPGDPVRHRRRRLGRGGARRAGRHRAGRRRSQRDGARCRHPRTAAPGHPVAARGRPSGIGEEPGRPVAGRSGNARRRSDNDDWKGSCRVRRTRRSPSTGTM